MNHYKANQLLFFTGETYDESNAEGAPLAAASQNEPQFAAAPSTGYGQPQYQGGFY